MYGTAPACTARAVHERDGAPRRIPAPCRRTALQRRPASDQHVIVAGAKRRGWALSRTISRNRRRTRFRCTALPTCLDTVKPTRTGRVAGRFRRAARLQQRKRWPGARAPAAAARKSVRRFNRSMSATLSRYCIGLSGPTQHASRPSASSYALSFLRPCARRAVEHLAAALGRHAGAEAVTALAHQFARLVGPFHAILQLQYWRGLYGSPSGPSNAV